MIQFWIPPPVGKLRWPSRFWQWAEIELLGLRLLPNGNHVYRGVWWHILCHRYWAWFSSSLLTSGPCKYLNMYCLDDHWCNVVFDHLSGLLKRETDIVSYRNMTPCNVCSSNIRSRYSSNLLVYLLRILLEQTLHLGWKLNYLVMFMWVFWLPTM